MALVSVKSSTCPYCAEPVPTSAIVCRACGRPIAPAATPPPVTLAAIELPPFAVLFPIVFRIVLAIALSIAALATIAEIGWYLVVLLRTFVAG